MVTSIQNQKIVKRHYRPPVRDARKKKTSKRGSSFADKLSSLKRTIKIRLKRFLLSYKKVKGDEVGVSGEILDAYDLSTQKIAFRQRRTPLRTFLRFFKSYKNFHKYAVGALVVFVIGLLLIFGIPATGIAARENRFFLPEDSGLENLLVDYIQPQKQIIEQYTGKPIDTTQFESISLIDYQVGEGDTISGIAQKYNLNLDTIISFNGIEDVRRLPIGKVLQIPNRNGVVYRVKRGDSLSSISRHFGVSLNRILDANNMTSEIIYPNQEIFVPDARMKSFDLKKAMGELFIYPASGRMTSRFGMRSDPFTGVRRFHNGIDLANDIGTVVNAAMPGKVSKIGVHPSYGKYVILSHDGGYQTWYAHLHKATVTKGQYVVQGQKIGEMGNTGYSTGSHLHFSIFKRGTPVDPLAYLH